MSFIAQILLAAYGRRCSLLHHTDDSWGNDRFREAGGSIKVGCSNINLCPSHSLAVFIAL